MARPEWSNLTRWLRSRAGWLLLPTGIAVGLQLGRQYQLPVDDRFADLQVYRGAAKSMLAGGEFYDFTRFNGDVFTYPPIAGYLLVWTAVLPLPVVEILWEFYRSSPFLVLPLVSWAC